jgi:ComF family protein
VTHTTRFVHQFERWLLDLILPPSCVVCRRVGTWLCEACAAQMVPSDRAVCSRCGDGWEGPGVCMRCRVAPLHVAPIRSVFLFEGSVRESIHALKYRGGRDVALPLGMRMADVWTERQLTSDLLVPVPLHVVREAKRGYNQSALLARELARRVGIPLEECLLFRIHSTASQAKLERHMRWPNVRDAFSCPADSDLSGMSVTLVDDVATTGATLEACAVALLAQGARRVNAFTLSHAV